MSISKFKYLMSGDSIAISESSDVEADDESCPIVTIGDLFVPGICLLTITLGLDSFYSRLGVPFLAGLMLPQFWIMNLALVIFLLGTGVMWFYVQEYLKKEVFTYFFRRNTVNLTLSTSVDIAVGFCVPCVIFPFWLSVREGTIECFLKHDCQNVFGVLYLGITDILCNTDPSEITGSNTPVCEGIIYALPLLMFTAVPVILALILHSYQFTQAEEEDSLPSTPETPTPTIPEEIPLPDHVVPLPVVLPKGFRPAHIRFSVPPQHPPISSSTVLGD